MNSSVDKHQQVPPIRQRYRENRHVDLVEILLLVISMLGQRGGSRSN